LPITKSGYLYIYVSNATPGWDVYFDNLSVKTYSGALVEEDHYYPFGLTMAGISDKAIKGRYAENKYRFQKQELQNKEFSDGAGLEMYEFKYRFDDPQIGRFWSVDPLANKYEYYSPYAFSGNKVTGHIELEGLEPVESTNGDVPNPYIRILLHGDVQKRAEEFEGHADKAAKITVTVGPGIGIETKIGKVGSLKLGAAGPTVSVSTTLTGKVSGQGSAASVSAGGSAGPLGAGAGGKLAPATYKDGNLNAQVATFNSQAGIQTPDVRASKKVGDEHGSEEMSASFSELTFKAHFGVAALEVKADIAEAVNAVGSAISWVRAVFASAGDEAMKSTRHGNDGH